MSTNQGSIWSASRRSIYGLKNYLQVKVWPLDWRSIWFADWRTICRLTNCKSKKYSICRWETICRSKKYWSRSKNYIQSNNYICRSKNYIRSADRRTICRWKNYIQIEELSANWRTICKLKNCLQIKEVLICRLKNVLQIEELFADERTVCRINDYSIGRLNNDLQIKDAFDLKVEEVSMDWRSIWFANWKTICRLTNCKSKKYSICRLKNYLQIEELFADRRTIEADGRTIFDIRTTFADQRTILDLQIEEPSANWRTICKSKNYRSRSKNYIQPKNCICRLKKYICRSKNYIGSADWRYYLLIINCLQIKEVFDLQVEEVSVDQRTIFRKKFDL